MEDMWRKTLLFLGNENFFPVCPGFFWLIRVRDRYNTPPSYSHMTHVDILAGYMLIYYQRWNKQTDKNNNNIYIYMYNKYFSFSQTENQRTMFQ